MQSIGLLWQNPIQQIVLVNPSIKQLFFCQILHISEGADQEWMERIWYIII